MNRIYFSTQIIIPCYNEFQSLELLVQECVSVHKESNYRVSFILVDNGSNDGSQEFFTNKANHHPGLVFIRSEINLGYGGGIKFGLSKASADFVGWTHADLQTPLRDILGALTFQEESQFIKGSRINRRFSEKIFSIGMSVFESLLFQRWLPEINAQPTIFARELLFLAEDAPNDFSFDLYFFIMAKVRNLKIARFEVNFAEREYGHSKWNFGFLSKCKFIKRTIEFSVQLRRTLNADNRT